MTRFWKLAIANILSNLMVPLASLFDVAFLGHLDNIRYLAGVSLATILFNYIYWTFGFLRMGTTGITAQANGRKDTDEVLAIGLRHLGIALTLGVIIWLLQIPLRELGFTLLSATPAVKAAGKAYYNANIWGAPATLMNFVLIGWFLGREQSRKVLLISAIGNGANVALNYGLIVRLGWASTGAGVATAASQYITFMVGMAMILREKPWETVSLSFGSKLRDRAALKAIFSLNGNILIRTFALVSTFAAFTNISSAIATLTLVTNTLLLQVVSFSAYFIDGLAFATESLAGNFYASGDSKQLRHLIVLSGKVSLALGLGFAILFISFPELLFGLLTDRVEVIQNIKNYTFWLLPVLGFGAIAYMLDGYFLGIAAGSILRNSSLWATGVGFVPVAVFAWLQQSPHLLWLALTCFMVGRVVALGSAVVISHQSSVISHQFFGQSVMGNR
ncbi:MAG: guanitoxin biosynthesis MATE family efflux transporter GntT, partial [Spirulinaceae cyanobacterium]